ncbi:MAG: oligosaccharyl transferase, archaeosortase A system-associated [Candidatus Methanoperedens sp.]|nr:oligosaccharyl transferase, archaeosortase A system-associated [Candidatus Methanoperedens sp.]
MAKNRKHLNEKKSTVKVMKQVEKELEPPRYFSYIFTILLFAIFALSLYLRTVMPYDGVFRNGVVAFASDDAVFQMRLVENTLYNFPHRITFDIFTRYPYGTPLHWGPLWTQLIATISLIVGLGSYNMQTVNTIGAYFPSVFGALIVFPVYYIVKSMGNRTGALLAAFMIAILPGQFFTRSTLGFTDNHVAEVLFSTATIMFFILSIKSGREINIKFSELHLKQKPVLYSILAGVMLAGYQLSWPGAPFFAMIIAIFILIQYIIDDMKDRSTDYLAIAAVPMFLIDLISMLPYFNPEYGFGITIYSWFHIIVPVVGMGLALALSIISGELKKKGYSSYYYPLSLLGFFALSMLIIKIILPQLYDVIFSTIVGIFGAHTTGGPATIGEAVSILEKPGMLYNGFPITGPLQGDNFVLLLIIALLLFIGYRIAKKQRAEDMLILVWSVVMLIGMYGQNRWAYYFALNAALLIGIAGGAIINSVLKWGGWQWQIDAKKISISHILSLIIVMVVVLFFAYPSVLATAIGENPVSKWEQGDPSGGGFYEWYETLTWMRDNTPDPGIDYFAVYKDPKNGTYPYPDTAYGVMSWWDYGHAITYWAHRIPNANPFQSGIGGGSSNAPGASTFLTAKTEEQADEVIYALGINGKPGARYVVSNAYMAYQIMEIFGIWNEEYDYWTQIRTRDGPQRVPTRKYYEVMEAKLHIFDGNGLKRYRLVHESPRNPYSDEQWHKNVYNLLYGGQIPVENSGLVKVFEFVKGANITGRAPQNSTVTISNTVKTNIGRTIKYSQTTTAYGGTYVFTVPYSTRGPIAGETNFDTQPEGKYTVTAGNVTKQVDVGERDVLDGGTVTLDLIPGK